MSATSSTHALSTAVAIASEDPKIGAASPKARWTAEVTACELAGADRRIRVLYPDGSEAVLTRYVKSLDRPPTFPQSICFIESEVAWAGQGVAGPVCVWIAPSEPEEVASRVAADSLQTGWEFEGHANLMFGSVNSISFRKAELRRAVSIISGNVLDQRVVRPGTRG